MKFLKSLLLLFLLIPPLASSQTLTLDSALPAHSPKDQIVKHTAYILKYNEKHEQADWVIYRITADRMKGTVKRKDNFRPDPSVKTGSATLADYKGSGYDRGHLAPAAVFKWSKEAMSQSFFMSNMSPQVPGFNRGIWKKLEAQVRTWAVDNEEIYVVTGAVLQGDLPAIGVNEVSIPEYYYKVILDYKEPEIKGIGFILPNESSKKALETYVLSIDEVEKFTGFDFFPVLPDNVEENIESGVNVSKWSFKSVSSKKNKNIPPKLEKNSDNSKTVYITKTGKKYHKDGCSSLKRSKIPISLKEAKEKGFTACKRCKPPIK